MRGLLFIALVGLAFALGGASPAYGHALLASSNPPQNTVLPSSPEQVKLLFSERVEPRFTNIIVLDSLGRRVDLGDVRVSSDQLTVMVGLQQLQPGVYTVSWRAMSVVDGHITSGAFTFGVGDVVIRQKPLGETGTLAPNQPLALEAALRWINFLSQTLIGGGLFFALSVWRASLREASLIIQLDTNKINRSGLHLIYRTLFFASALGFFGALATLLMQAFISAPVEPLLREIGLQAAATGHHIAGYTLATAKLTQLLAERTLEILQTRYGIIWLARIVIIAGLTFAFGRALVNSSREPSERILLSMLVATEAILLTSSLVSHNAAVTYIPILGIISDWVHLTAVGAWVGGLLYLALVMPQATAGLQLRQRGILTALLIPRFSSLAIVSVGVIAVTGLYSVLVQVKTVNALFSTQYGITLLSKVALAAPIVVLGAFNQLSIHRALAVTLSAYASIQQRLSRLQRRFHLSVRTEAVLGVGVLLIAAVLTASPPVLPISSTPLLLGSSQPVTFEGESEGVRLTLAVSPLQVGVNDFEIQIADLQSKPVSDVKQVSLEFRYLGDGVGPLSAIAEARKEGIYFLRGGFLSLQGNWVVEVQVRRETAYDAIVTFRFSVPRVPELGELKVFEMRLPEGSAPHSVLVSPDSSVWITASGSGKLLNVKSNLAGVEEFTLPRSGATPALMTLDSSGRLWITDPQFNRILLFDPRSKTFTELTIPTPNAVPYSVAVDKAGNVWFTETVGNKIGVYFPNNMTLKEYLVPTSNALPYAIAVDPEGLVWFTEAAAGKIGQLNPNTGKIEELQPPNFRLIAPNGIVVTRDGKVWFTEHGGNSITRFNPILREFTRHAVTSGGQGPLGVAFDAAGRAWFVLHLSDSIAVFDVGKGLVQEYRIPTLQSNTQWLAVDSLGYVWFAEQSSDKVGILLPRALLGSVQSDEQSLLGQLVSYLAVLIAGSTAVVFLVSQRRFRHSLRLIQSDAGEK